MHVPAAMRPLTQWVCWKLVQDRKVPVQPNGQLAKSNDPATWNPYDICQRFNGPGFVFADGGGLYGIDIDNCLVDGQPNELAREVLSRYRTYTEVSPSGTGLKLYCAGQFEVPGRNRNGLEIYCKGRFFCFTGQHWPGTPLECMPCDPNWVLERTEPPKQEPPVYPLVAPDLRDMGTRVSSYMATCEPAIAGQGGHGVAYRVANVLVRRFNLSVDEALPYFREWNERCVPPWTERELRHKLEDAAKAEGPRGDLCEDRPLAVMAPGVDLSQFLVDRPIEPAEVICPAPRNEFPEEVLEPPGFLGEVVRWNLRTSMWPQPQFALAGALSLLSVITGRAVTDPVGTRTNAYIMSLGPSGIGKDHARKINKIALGRTSATSQRMLGPERLGSAAGLVTVLSERGQVLMQIDEIGRLLQTMRDPKRSPHLFNIGTTMMQLYSSADVTWQADAYADSKKNKTIEQPHLCVYGTSTSEGFWESLSADNVGDGLLGRMMFFEGGFVQRRKDIEPIGEIPDAIRAAIEWWPTVACQGMGDLSGVMTFQPRAMAYSPLARVRLEDHWDAIADRRAKEESIRASVWSRATERTSKLALLFAASRATPGESLPQIEIDDVNRAIRLSNWMTRRLLQQANAYVAENEAENNRKRILRMVRDAGAMTLTQLNQRVGWLRAMDRKMVISDLVESGLLVLDAQDSESGKGRKKTVIMAADL